MPPRNRRRSKPVPLAEALTRVLRSNGLETTLNQVELCRRWSDVVGPQMARNAWVEILKEGQLVICTDHPAWKHEIHFRQDDILRRVNAMFGKDVVKSISTLVRPRPVVEEPVLQVRPQAQDFGAETAAPVDDEVLREAIKRAAAANAEARYRGRLR